MNTKNSSIKPTIIRPVSRLSRDEIREFYRYRNLLWNMILKAIRIDFGDMTLGFFWAVVRPVAMVFIFTFIRNKSGANLYVEIAYPLYLYSGLIFWFHFRDATMATAKSIMKDAVLMKRVYFPRIFTPIVPGIAQLYTLAIAMIPLAAMMVWFGIHPGWRMLLLPLVVLQTTLLIIGIGLIFACLIIARADFEKLLNICLYLGLFVSPVIFSPEMIPKAGRWIYFMNPMAGNLLAFRSCLFDGFPFPTWQFFYSSGFAALCFIGGLQIYRKAEILLADKI
jgi:lipopolysaccharide transport system permease protein